MTPYKKNFISFCLNYNVLKFGQFTLKSGRPSPYFFNAGDLNDGEALNHLGESYAETIQENFHGKFDLIFGPAYKGIPLAVASAMAMSQKFQMKIPVSYNRKEAKTHGEGGITIGASMKGKRVLIIDDVMTAGTALRDSAELIAKEGGVLSGAVIALNRQERSTSPNLTAVQEMEALYGIKVASIIDAYSLIEYLDKENQSQALKDHLEIYGVPAAE